MSKLVRKNKRFMLALTLAGLTLSVLSFYSDWCDPIDAGLARITVTNTVDVSVMIYLNINGPENREGKLSSTSSWNYDVVPGRYTVTAGYFTQENMWIALKCYPSSFNLKTGKTKTVKIE